MDTPTAFLVDDDPAVLAALTRLLRSVGYSVMTFASAQSFLDGNHDAAAGCLVLDVEMPGVSGVELQQMLSKRGSVLPIIFLTGHGDINMGVRAIKVGAADFLTKPVDVGLLFEAIRCAFERNRLLRSARSAACEIQERLTTLTPREREVLPLIVAGRMNKQAAAELGTVEKTIKVHRARVMAKLNVRTLADLVRLADKAGVPPPPIPQPR